MNEVIQTMREAQNEIRELRRRCELLQAKVEVFDSMMLLLHTPPAGFLNKQYSPDVLFAMEKQIAKLEDEDKPEVAEETQGFEGPPSKSRKL